MDNEMFDDGLVHGHHWATEKPATVAMAPVAQVACEDEFDDGLVHSHDWASNGK